MHNGGRKGNARNQWMCVEVRKKWACGWIHRHREQALTMETAIATQKCHDVVSSLHWNHYSHCWPFVNRTIEALLLPPADWKHLVYWLRCPPFWFRRPYQSCWCRAADCAADVWSSRLDSDAGPAKLTYTCPLHTRAHTSTRAKTKQHHHHPTDGTNQINRKYAEKCQMLMLDARNPVGGCAWTARRPHLGLLEPLDSIQKFEFSSRCCGQEPRAD